MTKNQLSKWTQLKSLIRHPLYHYKTYKNKKKYPRPETQWGRIVMDKETDKLIRNLDIKELNVLEISGNKWGKLPFKKYTSIMYPELDICERKLDATYDLIICEQVFEHLLWPYRAGKNIYDMLEEGGHFMLTTPFLIKIHNSPVDCSRWSKLGLKYFLAECGFPLENIESFSWGNKATVVANFKSWIAYNSSKHSLENEEEFPYVVWAIARK